MLIRLVGGLGNQMFIYAFAKAMSLKGYPILLDATYFNENLHKDAFSQVSTNSVMTNGGGGQDLRLFELALYNISLPLCFDYKSLVQYFYSNDKSLKYRFPRLYIRYATRKKYHKLYWLALKHYKYFYDEDPQGDNIVKMYLNDSLEKHAYPFGYFQNLIYFNDIYSTIREEFCLKIPLKPHNQALKEKIEKTENSVFLHVRLGDYLKMEATNGNLVRLGKTYYQSAIEILKTKLGQPHIFIFSNDIDWCEKNLCNLLDFKGCHIEFVKANGEGNAAEEMELMRVCKHAVIANSTFSWWASYLIDNPDKQIIMPTQVFNDTRRIPKSNMLAKKGYILIDPFWGTHSIV